MKKYAKLLSLAVALCLVLGLASTAYASMPDVNSHWAQASVEKWVDSGLAKGYPDGTFKPDNNITRAEFVALLNRAFTVQRNSEGAVFSDVAAADWYYTDVCAATSAGYVKGYEDNTFRPDKAITRAEAAAIVARMLDITADEDDVLDKFNDAAAISDWAKASIAAMVQANLLSGYPDGTFGPERLITRAESIVTLDRSMGYKAEEVPVTGVKLDVSNFTLKVDGTKQLEATVMPANASIKAVTWKSGNEKVATVDDNGKVKAIGNGNTTITVTTLDGNKTATCNVAVIRTSGGGGGSGSGTVTPVDSVKVTLAETPSGIGKVASVTLTGYAEAAQYQLFKEGIGELTGKVNIGDTEAVLLLDNGDSVKVLLYKADGTLLNTVTVTAGGAAVTPPTGTVKVTLADTPSGIGKEATVAITGYAEAVQYQLYKDGIGELTGKVNIGDMEAVLFLNNGDSVKVLLYKTDGTLLDTVTVTANSGGGGVSPPPTGTVKVTLADTPSGIGKEATVTITEYAEATQYQLFKDGIGELTGKVNIGDTEAVLFLNNGDSVKVLLYKADGTLLDTVTITAN